MIHRKTERMGGGGLVALSDWVAAGRALLIERRTLRAHAPGNGIRLLDWESELRPAGAEAVTLEAHKLRFDGLGIRFVLAMDNGETLNAEGTRVVEQVNGQPARWCAYAGELEGGGYGGAAIFDHPANPRHPTPFWAMKQPFGYLSAAPTFHGPLRQAPGRPLRFRYRLAAFLGKPEKARLESLYRQWVAESRSK